MVTPSQDALTTGGANAASSNGDLNHAANVLVVVCVNCRFTDCSTVTIAGAAMTKLTDAGTGGQCSASIWYAFRSTAANENIIVTPTGASQHYWHAISYRYTMQWAPFFEDTATATGDSTTASVTVAVGSTGRRIIQLVATGWGACPVAPGVGQTEIAENGTGNHCTETNHIDSAAATTMTATFGSWTWTTIGTAIIPGLAGTGEEPISPSAPFMPIFANPVIAAWCPTVAFTEINACEVRLGSNGSMGSWSFIIPDQEGLLYDRVVENDPIRIMLRQGPVERQYLGVLESRSHVRSGRRRGNYLKIQGRGFGVYFLRREKDATYVTTPIFTIIADPTTGLASVCSEIVFGNFVRDPAVSVSTVATKRTIASVLSQCMISSGSATVPWTYWVCHGEHPTEDGKPNLHFREKSYTPTPIVFTHHDVFSAERVSTVEFLQNRVRVEYGAAGLTELRDDAASQTAYGIIYKYVYAPFLTTAAAADDWGDKWLYGSKSPLKAISLTVPFNLFVEPNLVVRYIEPTLDQQYEVSTVTHRGDERGARTIIYAGTTVL